MLLKKPISTNCAQYLSVIKSQFTETSNSTFSTLFEMLPLTKEAKKKFDMMITRLTNVNYEDKSSTKP